MDKKVKEQQLPDGEEIKPKKKKGCFGKVILGIFIFLFLLFLYRLAVISYFANSEENTKKTQNADQAQEQQQTKTIVKSTQITQGQKSFEKEPEQSRESEQQQAGEDQNSKRKNSLLTFFIETAVKDYQDRQFFVTRWKNSNISVGVAEGTFTDSLNGCLNSFITDFNTESASVKLFRDNTVDTGIPNVKIYYWDDAKFKQRAGNTQYGITEWIHKDDKSLQRSMMFLSEDLMNADEAVRCQVIRHEMMHAVGFWGHDNTYFESIMSSPKTRYIYPEEDKILVKMLYNSGVAIGSDESAARSYLDSHFSW